MQGFHRQVAGRCPCGAHNAACGPPSTSIPIDLPIQEAAVGGQLKKYTVTLHGTRTVMKLNAADAERLGGVPLDEPEPEAGPETPPAGETTSEPFVEVPESKRRPTAANKARTAAPNKGGEGVDD
jgi:hypothetical protein